MADNRQPAEMAALREKINRLGNEIREREQAIHDLRASLRLLENERERCRGRMARLETTRKEVAA
jgi:predicted  nucleic acid-binding Zn-ribbon protein